MEIIVNEKPIDFRLEKKMTLEEILDEVQEWAGKESMFILDYRVDGSTVEAQDSNLNSETIKKIEILLGNKYALMWENLNETEQYIIKMFQYLVPRLQDNEKPANIDAETIKNGLMWILNSWDSLIKNMQAVKKENLNKEYIEESIKNENYIHVLNFLSVIMDDIKKWKKQVFYIMLDNSDIEDLRNMYTVELNQAMDQLEKIASNFTIGKDLDALSGLENVIEWISIGLMVFEKSGTPAEKIQSVKNVLDELSHSLARKDFVTLADILDFDLKDALGEILLAQPAR